MIASGPFAWAKRELWGILILTVLLTNRAVRTTHTPYVYSSTSGIDGSNRGLVLGANI